jgi:hypothetical protein
LTPYYSDRHYTATLRYNSPHFTQLHFATLHYTYRHFTSSHLHLTTLSFSFTHLHFLSFYFTSHHITSHHITRHSTDLIPKIISKKVNPFTALKNFSPFHFTSLFILFIYLFTYPINPSSSLLLLQSSHVFVNVSLSNILITFISSAGTALNFLLSIGQNIKP